MINLYYKLQFSNKYNLSHLITIDVVTDTNQEFHGEICDYSDLFISNEAREHIIPGLMFSGMISSNLHSQVHIPQRNTQIYNGNIDDLEKYPNIDVIHMIGKLADVVSIFNYWLSKFKLTDNEFTFIGDDIEETYPILFKLINPSIGPIDNKFDILIDIHTALVRKGLVTYDDLCRYTDNSVSGKRYNSVHDVKLIQELYHRLSLNGTT